MKKKVIADSRTPRSMAGRKSRRGRTPPPDMAMISLLAASSLKV